MKKKKQPLNCQPAGWKWARARLPLCNCSTKTSSSLHFFAKAKLLIPWFSDDYDWFEEMQTHQTRMVMGSVAQVPLTLAQR